VPAAQAAAPVPVAEAPAGKGGAAEVAANTGSAPATSAPPVATAAAEVALPVYAFEVKGQDLQNKAKRENTVSWDEFVRQTTQAPAKQP